MSDIDSSGGGERISATVKWFNPIKGLWVRPAVKWSGRRVWYMSPFWKPRGQKDLQDGAELECEIEQGPRGPMVSVIHSVTGGQVEASVASDPDAPVLEGVVKFFDPNKGYGFITPDGEGSDVFVSGRVVAQSGLRMLDAEARVRVATRAGEKGPLAVTVELIDDA